MPRCIENVIIIRIRIIITIDRKSHVVIFAVSFLQPKILWNIEIKVIVVIKHKHKIFDLRLVYVKCYCIGTLKMHNGLYEVVGPLPYHTWQSLAGSPHLTVLRFSVACDEASRLLLFGIVLSFWRKTDTSSCILQHHEFG